MEEFEGGGILEGGGSFSGWPEYIPLDFFGVTSEHAYLSRLGLKGKIDLSVNVAGSTRVLPLELKTGKPTFSSEHSGRITGQSTGNQGRNLEGGGRWGRPLLHFTLWLRTCL